MCHRSPGGSRQRDEEALKSHLRGKTNNSDLLGIPNPINVFGYFISSAKSGNICYLCHKTGYLFVYIYVRIV